MPEGPDREDAVELELTTGGLAFRLKGRARPLHRIHAIVWLRKQRVRLQPFLEEGQRGEFDRGTVRIESADGHVSIRHEARPDSRKLRWDDLDLLYFVGYALWNYVAVPHILLDLPHHELSGSTPGGNGLKRISVTFPEDIHTHSREQVFHIDGQERIRRHDYTAEVFGRWAQAAHFGKDHQAIGETWLATRRRVVPRLGRIVLPGPLLVWIELGDLQKISASWRQPDRRQPLRHPGGGVRPPGS